MKKVSNKQLQETYYTAVLDNGLRVYLLPKPGYYKTFGLFATHYGSLDNEFIPLDGKDFITVPYGIAHFLEHKVFEQEGDKDASELLAELGAEANAYTTYDRTAYLFSTTKNVEEATDLLLDFVQSPHFTEESVQAEQGIIEQELLMYLDRPDIALTLGGLQNMYKQNAIRHDIGGTRESIKQIDKAKLERCYKTFYHPENMVLALVGAFDPEAMLERIKNNQAKKHFTAFKPIKRRYYPEDNQVFKRYGEQKMSIIVPKTSVNLKIGYEKLSAFDVLKNDLLLQMLGDIYFSRTSDFYKELEKDDIINNSFNYGGAFDDTYAYFSVSCETLRNDEFNERIKQKLIEIRTQDIDKAEFERMKKVNLALLIRRLNSLEFLANLMVDLAFRDLELFDMIKCLESIKYQDLLDFRKHFVEKGITIYQILPDKKLTSD